MGQNNNLVPLLESAFKEEEDKKAFKTLYNLYHDKLFNYINSYTNSKPLTQDIIQDTFIKVWNSRESFDFKQSIGGYLYRMAYHTFVDDYRKKQLNFKLLDTLVYKKMNELIEEDVEEKSQKIKKIKKAIEELPPRCKEIFIMSKYQGYKYSEISEELGISYKTVENQIGKAYSLIKNKVKDKDFLNLFLHFHCKY